MKRLLVTGSREFDRADLVEQHLRDAFWQLAKPEYLPWSVTLVHGAARGADTLAAQAWQRQGMPIEEHPVTSEMWETEGKTAGHARNARMVAAGADLLVAFIQVGALNRGTWNCHNQARLAGIPTWEVYSDGSCHRDPRCS